eukprot:tig00021312_g20089.t1
MAERHLTPFATAGGTASVQSRLYFRHLVSDEDPVLERLRVPFLNLAGCDYLSSNKQELQYVAIDNTTLTTKGVFWVETDPSNPFNRDTMIDARIEIDLDPRLAPESLQLIGPSPGSTVSVNDFLLIAVVFNGVLDEPLPANCTVSLNLNFKTITVEEKLPRADVDALVGLSAAIGGAGLSTSTDQMLVYRHQIEKEENANAIAVRSPTSQALVVSAECSSTGMRFASVTGSGTSTPGFVFSPCKKSSTSPTGCEAGVTSVALDTQPPRMVAFGTRKAKNSVFFSGDAIDISVVFSKPVIYVTSADNGNPFAVGRPYLDLNSGGEAAFVGYFPNDNTTLLFRYQVGSGQSTNQKPLEVTQFVANGAVITSPNGLDIVANDEALKAVLHARSGLTAAGLIIQRSSSPRKLEVFGAVGKGQDVYSLNAIIYIILSFDDVVFPPTASPAALTACRPTLRTNVGVFQFIPRDEFNTIVQARHPIFQKQIVFQRTVQREDGLYDRIEIEKPYNSAVNATGCSLVETGMVIPVQLHKISGFYPADSTSSPFQAAVKITNVTMGLAPGRLGEIDILVTFSKPIEYQLMTDPITSLDATKSREVRLYGTPRIALNIPAYAYLMGYANPTSKTTLVFRYSVQLGEGTPAGKFLDVLSVNGFDSYGGVLRTSGNALNVQLLLPPPGSAHGLSSSRVTVEKVGAPPMPFGYDQSQPPTSGPVALVANSTAGKGTRHVLAAVLEQKKEPLKIEVIVQINSVIDVSTKDRNMKVDLTLMQDWVDSRFNNPQLAAMAENETSILNTIWFPRLSFVNTLGKPDAFDGKTIRYNNGTVRLYQRYIQTFFADINVRDFPFDQQTLTIQLRSNSYDATQLTFTPISGARLQEQEAFIRALGDPAFYFDSYTQEVTNTDLGIHANYNILTTSWKARRIRTYNVVNLLIPLLLICLSVIFTFFQPVESDNRVVACETALLGTLAFSFVLADMSPPVSYMTKMGGFTFQAYAFSIVGMAVNIAFNHVVWVVGELRRMDDASSSDDRTRINEHLYEALLKYKNTPSPNPMSSAVVHPKPIGDSPRVDVRVQMLQPSGRVPVEPGSAGAFPVPAAAVGTSATALELPTAQKLPQLGENANPLVRFIDRRSSLRLPKISDDTEVDLGDIVFKEGRLTTRATPEQARMQPPPQPDPKRLAGLFVPSVLPRKYFAFDLFGLQLGELRVANREVYIVRLRVVNMWVRAIFITAFIISTACLFTISP